MKTESIDVKLVVEGFHKLVAAFEQFGAALTRLFEEVMRDARLLAERAMTGDVLSPAEAKALELLIAFKRTDPSFLDGYLP